jgi:hypothetical protein
MLLIFLNINFIELSRLVIFLDFYYKSLQNYTNKLIRHKYIPVEFPFTHNVIPAKAGIQEKLLSNHFF